MDAPKAITLRADSNGPMQAASTSLATPGATPILQFRGDSSLRPRGDVTVHHHHYPYLELGSTRISPLLNIVDDTFSESEIYSNQLLRQKRGFPLYVPGPQQTLPEEYRKRGVAIGDVGRITPEGSFDFFFNIYLPADHPIHNRNVPEDFSPLPLFDTLDLYDQSYLEGHHVSTPSTQRLDSDSDIFPGGDFVFRCHEPQGAVLALPHGSHLQKLRNLEPIREYAARHAESWFKYVNGPRGRGLDGSLYLVTGSEKALSWGMASFHSVRDAFQLTFTLPAGASGYRWRGNPAQKKYHDPSPMHEPYKNQTTFIHGLSISLGTGVWARMFETVQIREIANTESRLGGRGGNSTSSSHGSSRLSRVLGFLGGGAAGGNYGQSRRHAVLSDFPPISQIIHPGELINGYILAKAPQATVVMSHDDDWCDIFGEGNPAQTMADLLQRIGDEYVVVEKGGATFLQAMSASARNESLELFGCSGSRTTSSTTHTSVTALDHNDVGDVASNPLHHHPALEFSSEDDDNQEMDMIEVSNAPSTGFIVTPVAFSHPPNMQAAQRPMGPRAISSSSPAVLSPGAPASAQTESPTSINTPPVFTMPTFAPPVSAVNPSPSPHSKKRGSLSSSGGGASFDGSGFDLDWSAMRSGISGLDMNEVYRTPRESRRPSQLSQMLRRPSMGSGGSVMYDPDTYSAAVRGWGGEEYERQRKYWTFRIDLADGRDGGTARGALPPSMRRIELGAQKPQQRVTIDPFRGPYMIGPKPPHDGAYTNIHKHSKAMAFSIHRHYKPTKAPPPAVDARWSFSVVAGHPSTATGMISGSGKRGSVSTASGRTGYARAMDERRRPTAMILLAPRHLQVAYTSTNTTKGLRSHGLLDEGPDRDRQRERTDNTDTTSTGRSKKGREKEKGRQNEGKDKENGGKDDEKASSSKQQTSSTASSTSTYRNEIVSPPPPPPSVPSTQKYPPPTNVPFDGRDANFIGLTLEAHSASSSRKRRDSLDDDSDSDSERVSSRTTHNEAFSTMDASSIDQMVLAPDTGYGEGSNGVLSRLLRWAPARGPVAPHQVYIPPWVTLQSRVKQEERRRRHDVLSNSFEDMELLPPKKSTGGTRARNAPGGTDIFAQVPSDALFMLLPLWPGPTDPVSERNATKQPHQIPTEQRQYLLVSYKPVDERTPPSSSKKHDKEDRRSKKRISHSSLTSSVDGPVGKGCDILLTSYHISAKLVSHADLQGSGVRVPDEGLAVLGPWHEAWLTMPQIAARDHGLLVIGTCKSRDAGIEFDPEGLVKMGLCIPVPQGVGADEEEPVAELTPIGKAVLEMAWIGCIAVTSFGPAGSS
ncbi:hypothetical protein MVEN_00273700 [Mycena venus]|uniref:Uncharacterized protein n=1 Tax=Mycena venus TaxID=2733690 RepID=A0A8H6YZM6_9AGAR|nr:hypothetical protein MVEN_00273700 [Mycena venus]